MSEQNVCDVCGVIDESLANDMCGFCNKTLKKRHKGLSDAVKKLEYQLQFQDMSEDKRVALEEKLREKYKELRGMEKLC